MSSWTGRSPRSAEDRPTLLFVPVGYGLSDILRLCELGECCRNEFRVLFGCYGGQYEHLIEERGHSLIRLEPRLTEEKIRHLFEVRHQKKPLPFYSKSEVSACVRSEIDLLRDLKPRAVITGWCQSLFISARACRIPLVSVVQSTWIRAYRESNMFPWPDMLTLPLPEPLRALVPEGAKRWIVNQVAMKLLDLLVTNYLLRPFSSVAVALGQPRLRSYFDLIEADINLLAEPSGFSALDELPPHYHFVGPLIGRTSEVAETRLQARKVASESKLPLVYFAMGCSGRASVIRAVLKGLAGAPVRVIAPIRHLLEPGGVEIPENVSVVDVVPALEVNRMASVALVHGGIGTLMTACLAGTPIVAIPMNLEQESNVDCLVKRGVAVKLGRRSLTPDGLRRALLSVLDDHAMRQSALAFREELRQYDAWKLAPRLLRQLLVEQES